MTTGVRPLDIDPVPPRRGALLATAAVVALGGFGIYLAGGGLSTTAPTTTASPATTTTTPESTTAIEAAGEELRTLVPGFQGMVRGIQMTFDVVTAGWSWFSGESEPRLVELPNQSLGSWARDGALIAATGESSFGRSLFFGPPTNVREVFNDVESFAWHSTEPGVLAFVTEPQADGMRELWRSLPDDTTASAGTFNASRVTRFDLEAALVAYGDWGYAMAGTPPSGDGPLLTSLDPEGAVVAVEPFVYVDDFGDGRLLVLTQADGPNPHLAIVDAGLGGAELIGPDAVLGGVLSPNRRWVASVSIPSTGATLWITDVPQTFERSIPLRVDVATFPVAWSSDGRWILLRAGPNAHATPPDAHLLFVDTGSEDVHVVNAEGILFGLTIQATGVPGPNVFLP